jgi:hypothetical protein
MNSTLASTYDKHTNYDEFPPATGVSVTFAKDEKRHLTPYEKLLYDSQHDARFKDEEKAGRRIGFYRIRTALGSGNFSLVKLGLHLLAKGNHDRFLFVRINKSFFPLCMIRWQSSP